MNIPMLTKITLTNEEELFTCKVDEGLFQKRYPLIYKSYKKQTSSMELWDVEEVLPDNESIEAILIKEEAVLIQFDNGEKATIYNTEIIKFSGISFDGFSVFADSAFVYLEYGASLIKNGFSLIEMMTSVLVQ
jgi:hypothetical protein